MLLRRLLDYRFLRQNPPYIALLAACFVWLGLLAAYLFFSSAMSLVMVAFSSLLILPYIIKILATEKTGDKKGFMQLLDRHDELIKFYIYMFLGMSLAYMVMFVSLAPPVNEAAFRNQVDLITPGPAGSYFNPGFFTQIVSNNLAIVFVCVFLSLFYGTGAIFILNYNASVLGTMYGSAVRPLVWGANAVPLIFSNMLAFVPHTMLEVLAYLFAAISGGILSNSILINRSGPKAAAQGKVLFMDSMFFLALAVVLILTGGVVETVLPAMFS